jgi:hypothetical protein
METVEKELNVLFPESFLQFAGHYGAIHTPDIQDLIEGVEGGTKGGRFDVQEFYSPNDILRTTQAYHAAGMDDSLVVFATDRLGNVFGFRGVAGAPRPDDATVYLFDHADCKTSAVTLSFDFWLQSFLVELTRTHETK